MQNGFLMRSRSRNKQLFGSFSYHSDNAFGKMKRWDNDGEEHESLENEVTDQDL